MVKYRLTAGEAPNEGRIFVDHESSGRSGHLSHALVEYAPGCVLAFYSNCSGKRNNGHSGFGWIEYRRSTDGARSFGEPCRLEYSWDAFLNETYTISCEKAVSVKENEIVLFCTRSINPNGWEPYLVPTVLKSTDGGESWRDCGIICEGEGEEYRGRVYDAIVHDGKIYVLELCNPAVKSFAAYEPSHKYQIFESDDGGESFHPHGVFPGDIIGLAYGNMSLTDDGKLICYAYNINDEYNLETCISPDFGLTWECRQKSYCAKRIRNPQVAKVRGGYILHGRSGCQSSELPMEFVLYTSEDGIHWDDGIYLANARGSGGCSFYSNNLVLNEGDDQRVLIQASIAYSAARTNIDHWELGIE